MHAATECRFHPLTHMARIVWVIFLTVGDEYSFGFRRWCHSENRDVARNLFWGYKSLFMRGGGVV